MAQQNAAGWESPYKFTGKVADTDRSVSKMDPETGLYYFGALYYNPHISLWMSVDPLAEKYPSISPYAYVANDPIMFIDPDGRDIVLPKGTSTKDTYTILGNLQKLTIDKLVYSTEKDGTIRIKIASLAKSGTEDKVTGTNLIRSLNSSDKTVTIMIQAGRNDATADNRTDAQNGTGTNSTVRIDPSMNVDLRVDDGKGGTKYETALDQVILGHELIHAKDHMEGTLYTKEANHSYKRLDGTTKVERHEIAEYRAVGFKGFVGKDGISENTIRKEQGVKQRASYEVYKNNSN